MTKKLTRSRTDKIFGGVLGGIAKYFGFDPVWVRLGFVAFALLVDGGPAIIAYIIALIIMPHGDGNVEIISDSTKGRSVSNSSSNHNVAMIFGFLLILLGSVFLIEQFYDFRIWSYMHHYYFAIRKYVLPTILIILGIVVIMRGTKK